MPTRNTDVNLVIRARNEADKAIDSVAAALDHLFDGAHDTNVEVADLAKTLGALDKAASQISGSMDKAGAAVDRQRASIAENNAAYAALLRQQADAQRVLGKQDAFIGPRSKDDIARYAATREEVKRLDAAVSNLFAKIGQQNSQLNGAQSSLLKLSSTSAAVAEGQAAAEARIELTTQAMREQEAQANRLSDVQRRINSVTGVDRPSATGSAYASASLLLQADEQYSRDQAVAIRAAADAHKLFEERVRAGAAVLREETEEAERLQAAADRRNSGAAVNAFEERARAGAAAMREEAQAADQMEREAQQLRAALDPLAAIQDRFNTSLARYRTLAAAGKISSDELAAAETHLAAEAEKARVALNGTNGRGADGKPSLFGLKPYELQNLSYQVNDVVTGLASGQHLTQIIAQQGGQILQLFPKVAGKLVGALQNPLLVGALGTVSLIALAIKDAADDAERLRTITGTLNFRADGGSYKAKDLAGQEKQFERMGATADEARQAITAFLDRSVDPSKLTTFAQAAQNTAETLGIKLPEAAKMVAEAFTGSYEAVAALDDKLNFLTATQREHIRTLFEEGRATEANAEALRIYAAKQQEMADKSRGEWAGAARELKAAWSGFIDLLSNTGVVKGFTEALTGLASAARVALDDVNNMDDAAGTLREIADLQKYIAELKAKIAKNPELLQSATGSQLVSAQNGLTTLINRYNELAKAKGAALIGPDGKLPTAAAATGGTTNGNPNSTVSKESADKVHQIELEDEIQRLRDAGQSRTLSATEKARRAELAGLDAARSASDSIVAGALRRRAVAHETAAIERESEARAKSARTDRERAIKDYLNAVVGAEGGTGRNKAGSSAIGAGQFLRGTFIETYKKINPTTSLSDDRIADLRKDSKVALQVLEVFTRQNAQFIQRAGKEVNGANLYLIHFLGQGTGGAVLRANPNTPVNQIIDRVDRNAAQVKSQNAGYLRTEGGKGRYRTASELQAFLGNRVGDNPGSRAQTEILRNEVDLVEGARQKQEAFNTSVRHNAEDRQRAIVGLKAEAGLLDGALLAEQRRQVIAQAELDLRQKVEDANKNLKPGEAPVVVSQEQIDSAKELAGALFDAQHARDALSAELAGPERTMDADRERVDLLKQQADYLRSIGDIKDATATDEKIVEANGKLAESIQTVIDTYERLGPALIAAGILTQQQIDNMIEKLKLAKVETKEWGKVAGVSANDIAHSFASSAAQAFTNFINKVAAGKNVFKSLASGIRDFAASFISSIAQMIVQLLAYAAAVSILKALGVPVPTTVGAGVHHGGGIVGSAGGTQRSLAPTLFANAMRYHTGGIAGFAPDEVPALLQRGEEVLTRGDPRHRANGGGKGSGGSARPGNVSIYNSFDPNEIADLMLRTPAGEKAILNLVRQNQDAFRAALG